jgi:hypothetical protein
MTLIGAGDIAACELPDDEATAALVASLLAEADGEAYVFTIGDNVYPEGAAEHFRACYAPTWGRFLDRTLAVPGNHDYHGGTLNDYFGYFGAAAGDNPSGWYERRIGSWQVLVLNSVCVVSGDCDQDQERWLRERLAATESSCTLALLHHPRYSSGQHGGDPQTDALWETLVDGDAELLVSGHDHSYERFAPMDADGDLDPEDGLRQFVVGTGGAGLRGFNSPIANSEVRGVAHGVLVLTLDDAEYAWEFVATEAGSLVDSGSDICH